jgi:plastocyanin
MRNARFPGDLRGQRIVSAISAVLVLGAVSTAVITSGAPAEQPPKPNVPNDAGGFPPPPGTPATAPETTAAAPAPTTTTSGPTTAAPGTLHLAANPGGLLRFSTSSLSAKAGTVNIAMTNMSPVEHNLTVEGAGKVLGATPTFTGGTRTLTLNLKPGTYTFYCSVPGHRAAGMQGTLTVK